jgi:hypothetical protein
MKKVFWTKTIIFAAILLLIACKKEKTYPDSGELEYKVTHWPVVKTIEVSNLTYTTATVNGTVNPNGLPTTVTFEYGLTNSYGQTLTAQNPVTGNDIANVRADISGLLPDTTYHFRVTAENSLWKNFSGSDKTFHTPIPETLKATNLTYTTATLNGTLNAYGLSAIVTFEYGLTDSYGKTVTAAQSPVTGNDITDVSADISGLTPYRVYHFRIKAENSSWKILYGSDKTFHTPMPETLAATNISPTGATLNGTVYSSGIPTMVTFEYGTDTSYGQEKAAEQSPVTGNESSYVSATLTGLAGGIYHFRVKTINTGETVYGDDMEFTICSYSPTVALLPVTNITPTGVTLNGTVNANGSQTTVTFLYSIIGLRGEGWKTVTADESPVTGYGITNVNANISGLTPGSTHEFYISATNSCGTTVTKYKLSFAGCSNVPTVAILPATNISATGVTLNGTINANGSQTTVTFLCSTAGCSGGRCPSWVEVAAVENPVNGNGITNVSANISGLNAGITRKFYITATNICGTVTSDQLSFTIPK